MGDNVYFFVLVDDFGTIPSSGFTSYAQSP
jgi:hypothetical protein